MNSGDLIQRYIGLFGIWEPHLTAWLQGRLGTGDVFIDVGAHIGYYALLGARLVGATGSVVAVEASPEIHRTLKQNLELNGCENVRVLNVAAGDTDEELTFTLASARNSGTTSIVPWDGPVETRFTIPAKPLPELLAPAEIAAVRVIKIDVEGMEGRVVRGLTAVLDQLRDDVEIAIEVTPERMRQVGDDVDDLLGTLHAAGFRTFRLPTDYRPESYPRAFARPQPPRRWSGKIEGETQLVFSRTDHDELLTTRRDSGHR